MKVGRRLAIKLLNAAKFALMQAEPRGADHRAARSRHADEPGALVRERPQLEDYDYAWVLEQTETFFWGFCDDYLELVKSRRYGDFAPEAPHRRTAPCSWRSRRCCACLRRSCRSSPRKCGRGGSRARCTGDGRRRKKSWRSIGGADQRAVFERRRSEALGEVRVKSC